MTRRLSVRDVLKAVADAYEVEITALVGQGRRREHTRPRQVAMFLARSLTTASLPMIGRAIGHRDHTSVLHGIKAIDAQIAGDRALADRISGIERALRSLAAVPHADDVAEQVGVVPDVRPAPQRKPTPPRKIVPGHVVVLDRLGRYLDSRAKLQRSQYTREEPGNRRQTEADFVALARAYDAYRAEGQP